MKHLQQNWVCVREVDMSCRHDEFTCEELQDHWSEHQETGEKWCGYDSVLSKEYGIR